MPNAILPYETYLRVLGLHCDWWTQELVRGNPEASRMRSSWGHGMTYEWLPALRPRVVSCLLEVSPGSFVALASSDYTIDPLARYRPAGIMHA
jgi:hypothetical protein